MKKLGVFFLLAPLFIASCGIETPVVSQATNNIVQKNEGYTDSDLILPNNPSNTIPLSNSLTPQVNEDGVCYTYSAWQTNQGCTTTQRDLVNFAGYIYRTVKPNLNTAQRRITIGSTYVNGGIVITVNGEADGYTKDLVRQATAGARWGYLTAAGADHAETALYKAFGGGASGKRDIGISNPSGPCPSCKSALASAPVNVTYYLNYFW